VSAFHLNDISKSNVKGKIIEKMKSSEYESSSSMLLLCSPQYITDNVEFRNTLIYCRDCQVLWLIAIDEAHLYVMHGRLFCDSIRQLKRDFFRHISSAGKSYTPLFLAMTATMPLSLLKSLVALTHFKWILPAH